MKPLERIGVFVCHCGLNIAGTVDVNRVVSEVSHYPGVVFATDYLYMCSDPGQDLMRKAIREYGLTGVVNANCSPVLHERTFRKAVSAEGINPYREEIANIREQCSWPHAHEKEAATKKAIAIIKTTIERLRLNMKLTPLLIPMTKRVLIIGGGVAGLQASLDIAGSGYEVVLVEKEDRLGGHVNELSSTFPAMQSPARYLHGLIIAVQSHPGIKIMLRSVVEEVNGYVGSFSVKINGDLQETVGAIIMATGYELLPRLKTPQFPVDPDVIDGLEFEHILSIQNGKTVHRPSDGKIPNDIVFIQCAGSRDPEHGVPYCSRVCCMYTSKQVKQYLEAVPEGQAFVCYMDLRSDAKGFEEFLQTILTDERALYIRGNVSRVFRDGDKLKIWTVDTLTDKSIEIAADMVVLATAMVPSSGTRELARKLNTGLDETGFLTEAHIKLRPVESLTAGIYLAGAAQWPRDIPDAITSASAAASKVISLFSRKEMTHEPVVAEVDSEVCSGCGVCVGMCAYKVITLDEKRKVAIVNEALCEGCGSCVATCPSKAIQHKNWTHRQLMTMIQIAASG